MRQVAAQPVYQIEDASALILRTASEHRIDWLEDHEHVGRDAEVLVQRVLMEKKVNVRLEFVSFRLSDST